MEKRLKQYIAYLEEMNMQQISPEDKQSLRACLLIQIQFFQHERLVHLIVTVAFALLLMLSLLGSCLCPGWSWFILTGLLLVLLIPYIRHYYILENGVQKLYQFYDYL